MPATKGRWRPLLAAAVVAGLALSFATNLALNARAPIVEPDEAYWIFSSYYYYLAFEARDLRSPDWSAGEAFDHPPLAKFLIGWALSRKGLEQKTIDVIRWRRQNTFQHALLPASGELAMLNQMIPLEALVAGRVTCCLLIFAASVLLFFLTWKVASPEAAVLAAAYFAAHPLVSAVSTFVLSDGLLISLALAAALIQIAWAEARDAKTRLGLCAALGLVCALAFDTKINGLLSLIAAGAAALAVVGCDARSVRSRIQEAAVVLLAFVAFAIACNPTFYRHPAGAFWEYFRVRDEWSLAQERIFFPMSLPTIALRISYALRTLIQADTFHRYIHIPLGLPFLALGIFSLPERFSAKRPASRIGLVHAAVWTAATVTELRMAWARYLLVVLPFVSLLIGVGLEELYKLRATRSQHRIKVAAACACLCVGAYWIESFVTIQRYFEGRPELLRRYMDERSRLETEARRREGPRPNGGN